MKKKKQYRKNILLRIFQNLYEFENIFGEITF